MMFWKGGDTYAAKSNVRNFPYTWEVINSPVLSGIRPLIITDKEKIYVIVNVGNAKAISIYEAKWNL